MDNYMDPYLDTRYQRGRRKLDVHVNKCLRFLQKLDRLSANQQKQIAENLGHVVARVTGAGYPLSERKAAFEGLLRIAENGHFRAAASTLEEHYYVRPDPDLKQMALLLSYAQEDVRTTVIQSFWILVSAGWNPEKFYDYFLFDRRVQRDRVAPFLAALETGWALGGSTYRNFAAPLLLESYIHACNWSAMRKLAESGHPLVLRGVLCFADSQTPAWDSVEALDIAQQIYPNWRSRKTENYSPEKPSRVQKIQDQAASAARYGCNHDSAC